VAVYGNPWPTDRFLALRLSVRNNIESRDCPPDKDRKIARSGERKEAPRSIAKGRATDERSGASNFTSRSNIRIVRAMAKPRHLSVICRPKCETFDAGKPTVS
jgi:hypothetical protein